MMPECGLSSQSPTITLAVWALPPPPQQRAQPGLQFDEAERLGQVVVHAAVQPFHDVVHLRERGQHQRGCSDAGAAQGANQIQPVAVGQPAVDDQRVMLLPYPIGTPLKRR